MGRQLAAVLFLTLATAASADDPEVDEAIRKGVAWLKARQRPAGHFGDAGSHYWGRRSTDRPEVDRYHHEPGYTAFAAMALLACGTRTTAPVVTRAFSYLRRAELKGGNEHAIVVMALREQYDRAMTELALRTFGTGMSDEARIETYLAKYRRRDIVAAMGMKKSGALGESDHALVERCVAKLVGWQHEGGGWRYGDLAGDAGDHDVVATHLALSGLKAAVACGVRVDAEVFARAARYLLAQQADNGPAQPRGLHPAGARYWSPMPGDRARGWPYMRGSQEARERRHTGATTAAGVVGLLICRSQLRETPHERELGDRVDRATHDGLAWLHANWVDGLARNPSGFRGTGYHWWVVARLGRLGGLERIGAHDWYAEGVRHLVAIQKPTVRHPKQRAFWDVGAEVAPADELNTIYALLFLRRHGHRLIGGRVDTSFRGSW